MLYVIKATFYFNFGSDSIHWQSDAIWHMVAPLSVRGHQQAAHGRFQSVCKCSVTTWFFNVRGLLLVFLHHRQTFVII